MISHLQAQRVISRVRTSRARHGAAPGVHTVSRGALVCRAQSAKPWDLGADEPARHMALPGGALWLLSYLQDQFYDIRGPQFVITRNESTGTAIRKIRSRNKALVHSNTPADSLGLIHQATRTFPWASTQLLEGSTIDISQYLEACSDEEDLDESGQRHVSPNTSCTGIVRVETEASDQSASEDEDSLQDVFYTNSASPRRTKMIGFTCKCCGARNYNSVNPRSFLEGTLVAQCAKCERWHKLSDHFNLFHDLQGPLFHAPSGLTEDDVPPSLRLDRALWREVGEDGFVNLKDEDGQL